MGISQCLMGGGHSIHNEWNCGVNDYRWKEITVLRRCLGEIMPGFAVYFDGMVKEKEAVDLNHNIYALFFKLWDFSTRRKTQISTGVLFSATMCWNDFWSI